MNIQTIKILAGALALRRFTAADLASHVGANPHTVASVLQRNGRYFDRGESIKPAGGRGRPARGYLLKAAMVAELTGLLSGLSAADLAAAGLAGDWSKAIEAGLERAERYHLIYDKARNDADRTEAWEWFEDAFAVVQQSLEQVGKDRSSLPREWLVRSEALEAKIEDGFASYKVVDPRPLDVMVFEIARDCVSRWEDGSLSSRIRIEDLVDLERVGPVAGSMGILAALGLTKRLPDADHARLGLREVVDSLSGLHIASGLEALLDQDVYPPVTDFVVPAVALGLRSCRNVLGNEDLKNVFRRVQGNNQWSPAIRGSFLMAREAVPFERFEVNSEDFTGLDEWDANASDLDLGPGPFGSAMTEVMREAAEYDLRLRRQAAEIQASSSPRDRFFRTLGSRSDSRAA